MAVKLCRNSQIVAQCTEQMVQVKEDGLCGLKHQLQALYKEIGQPACQDLQQHGGADAAQHLAQALCLLQAGQPMPALESAQAAQQACWAQLKSAQGWQHPAFREAYVLASLCAGSLLAATSRPLQAMHAVDMAIIMGAPLELAAPFIAAIEPPASQAYRSQQEGLQRMQMAAGEAQQSGLADDLRDLQPPEGLQADDVEHVHVQRLTPAAFQQGFYSRDRQVLIEGALDGCPAMSRWQRLSWWHAAHGHRTVPIEHGSKLLGDWREDTMLLSQMVDEHLQPSLAACLQEQHQACSSTHAAMRAPARPRRSGGHAAAQQAGAAEHHGRNGVSASCQQRLAHGEQHQSKAAMAAREQPEHGQQHDGSAATAHEHGAHQESAPAGQAAAQAQVQGGKQQPAGNTAAVCRPGSQHDSESARQPQSNGTQQAGPERVSGGHATAAEAQGAQHDLCAGPAQGAAAKRQPCYCAQHALLDQLGLRADVLQPQLLGARQPAAINAWLGTAGTVTPLHFDTHDNLLAQVAGFKLVLLYAACETRWLYAPGRRGSGNGTQQRNMSPVDPEQPDLRRYPLFCHAACSRTILKPGDMLFIPAKCWHYVRALTPALSVNFWY